MKSEIIGRPDEILLMEDNPNNSRPYEKLTHRKQSAYRMAHSQAWRVGVYRYPVKLSR
jgi:hypothetical protein